MDKMHLHELTAYIIEGWPSNRNTSEKQASHHLSKIVSNWHGLEMVVCQ